MKNPARYSRPAALLLAALAGLASPLHAQWTGAAANNQVNDSANWTGGLINGVFSANLGANTVLNTTGNLALPSGLSFLYADNFSLRIEPSLVATHTLALGGDITVDVAGNSASQVVTLGSTGGSRPLALDLDGATRTLAINPALAANATGRDTLRLYGNVIDGSLAKTGGGTVEFYNALSLDGAYVHSGGLTTLLNTGSFLSAERLVVANSLSRFVLKGSAADRLGDAIPVHLQGGIFGFQNLGAASSESIGTVHLSGARSALGVVPGSGLTTLHLAGLERDPYSTLSLVGTSTQAVGAGNTRVTVASDASLLADLVGGSGATGTPTQKILPWATAAAAVSNSFTDALDEKYYGPDQGLVTYTTAGGFRALDKTTEYVASLAASASASDNVRLTADETLAADRAVNALFLDKSSAAVLNLGGRTLTLGAGVLAANNSQVTISNGTIALGSRTGYVMLGRNAASAISAAFTGTAGVVFAPALTLTLSGANSYSGPTVVNSGVLALGANNTLPTATDVRIDKVATLRVNSGIAQTVSSLSGSGTVAFASATARLDVGASFASSAAGRVTIGSDGFVSPGDASGVFQASALTFGANISSLRFESGSLLALDLAAAVRFDSVALASGATVGFDAGSSLSLSFLDGFTPADGATFQLFSISGAAATGALSGVNNLSINGPAGYAYALDADGLLTVTAAAIPEPSAFALLGGAGALVLALRRRRR